MGGGGIEKVLRDIEHDFPEPQYALSLLAEKESGMGRAHADSGHRLHSFTMAAVELTTMEAPKWEFIAARLLDYQLHQDILSIEQREGITGFYEKIKLLTSQHLYGDYILQAYSEEEIGEAATWIDDKRDDLINFPDWTCWLSVISCTPSTIRS